MKQIESDVVVVAAGTAGLPAAIAAAEAGASVMVFEKASTTGGAGSMAWGPFAVESRLQHLKQISTTREEAFRIHMDFTHWRVDARLVKAFIDKSADTIDWLEKMGIEFLDVGCHNPGFLMTWHIVKGTGPLTGQMGEGYGFALTRVLTERAKQLGAKLYLRTPVRKIIKKENRVTGVIAEEESGEQIQVSAKAVVIATGGFGDNPEMIKKYTGYELGRDLQGIRVPGCVGDGLRMAWEAGAAPTEIAMELTVLRGPMLENNVAASFIFARPNLIVNLKGERFINEDIVDNATFIGNAITRQKNGCAFTLFDEGTIEYYQQKGANYPPNGVIALRNDGSEPVDFKQAIGAGNNKDIFVADSIEELAVKACINRDILLQTVAEYNQACETGRDLLFAKNARNLRPLNQPKFYAGKLYPGTIGSMGGIKINYKTEVLNKESEVIPGLYAAGLDACSIYADSYAFVLPGNTYGFALNSGRIARGKCRSLR